MKKRISQFFSALKLKQKVSVLFLSILLIYFILLVIVFYVVLQKQVYSYAYNNNQEAMVSIGKNLNSEVKKISNYSRLLIGNDAVRKYLKAEQGDGINYYNDALRAIYQIQNAYPETYSTYLIRYDNAVLKVGQGIDKLDLDLFFSDDLMNEIEEKAGGYVLRVNGGGTFQRADGEDVISMIRIVNDIDSLKPIGVMIVNFPVSVLESTYSEFISSDKDYAYYDRNYCRICGYVPYSAILQMVEYDQKDNAQEDKTNPWSSRHHQYINSYYNIPNTPYILMSREKVILWDNVSIELIIGIVAMILITGMGLLIIGLFISSYITKPIQKLVNSMQGVKEGWLRRVSFPHCDDEIGMLQDSYNEMLIETNQLIEQLLDKEASIKKAEFDILQEQIKPHFLYNTIEMIACLSMDGSRREVYGALETLGSFYRNFLSKGSSEVFLKTEVDIIKDYLKLEKLRYGDIFDEIFEIDEECMRIQVPKLMLQPLVENSLYHGIRPKGEKCIIKISVKRQEESIMIEVYDSGVGMSQEQLENILDNGKNFGLKRTLERFQYFAGERGSYTIESEESRFTCIRFVLQDE